MRHGFGTQADFPRAEDNHLHLPDASADRATSSGQLPDLRHGAGAENAHPRRAKKRTYGTARYDAPILDRRGYQPASLHSRDVAHAAIAPHWVQGDISRWVQFILSTPVVLWCGWPFFQRGWQSIVNRSLNMFTLIAIGVGAAYFYSAVVMLLPQIFPPSFAAHGKIGIYFEAAAIITVLVLLGQVLELRARSRTGSAIRALLDLAPNTARARARWRRARCAAR